MPSRLALNGAQRALVVLSPRANTLAPAGAHVVPPA